MSCVWLAMWFWSFKEFVLERDIWGSLSRLMVIEIKEMVEGSSSQNVVPPASSMQTTWKLARSSDSQALPQA